MIQATSSIDAPLTFRATVRGLAVYLDTWAVGDLAERNPSRRKRFVAAVCSGVADLMFSVTNAVELAGLQGKSFDTVKCFLNEVGPNWFPVELDVFAVVQRELSGADPAESCISEAFMKAYFANRTANYSPGSGRVIDLSEAFYGLGTVLDWVGLQRESIRESAATLDAALIEKINGYRAESKRDPLWLDQRFPALPFKRSMPATFAYVNLVRTLIEAKAYQLKTGDGPDFCHAVMASAFASVATLDKHWKRRVEKLPKPNKLARIYSGPELDKMVTDIESCVKQGGLIHAARP